MTETLSMVMWLSKCGWCIKFSLCIIRPWICKEKGSKVKLLRTDPVRSSPSAVSDFKRHVEGKRRKEYHDSNRTLHKDTSALLQSIQEKMARHLEDVDEMLHKQFKSAVSENKKILRSIIDTIIFLGGKAWL